jgi:hypothetical protein
MTPVGNHGALDARAGNQGSADLHFLALAQHEDLIECDFRAIFRWYLFYLDFLADANPILFAAGFYDRVHVGLQNCMKKRRDYSGSSANVKIDPAWQGEKRVDCAMWHFLRLWRRPCSVF